MTRNDPIIPFQPKTTDSPLTNCSSNPGLPAGLQLESTTCKISGTPLSNQNAITYTISATTAHGEGSAAISITIDSNPPSALVFTGTPFTFSTGNSVGTITPTYVGTITGCSSAPPLPTGLSLATNSCSITGAPVSVQNSASYNITGSNQFGGTSTTISILVTCGSPCRIFIPNPTQGNLGGIAGADSYCNSDPARPNGSSYKAMLVDSVPTRRACSTSNCTSIAENLNWPMLPLRTYYRADGMTPIFTTNTAGIFVFGTATNSPVSGFTWTSLNTDWTTDAANTCSNWSTNSVGVFSDDGDGSTTGSTMIRNGSGIHCGNVRYLYCVEQ